MPAVARWTHIALPCRDIDTSIEWYTTFTPLTFIERRDDADGQGAWLGDPSTKEAPFILVLVSFLADQDRPPVATMAPFAHLGIELPSREAVDEIAERGRTAGCLAWEPQLLPPPVGYICALTDPDGNVVEFSFDQPVEAVARRAWSSASSAPSAP